MRLFWLWMHGLAVTTIALSGLLMLLLLSLLEDCEHRAEMGLKEGFMDGWVQML